jgi:hypothetical protein
MNKNSPCWGRGFTVSLVVFMSLACSSFREDEFLCENAVSHLQGCCPGLDASRVVCSYSDQGCFFGDQTYPELDLAQSGCILSNSCEALRANGVCDRAAALPDQGLEEADAGTPVCGATAP